MTFFWSYSMQCPMYEMPKAKEPALQDKKRKADDEATGTTPKKSKVKTEDGSEKKKKKKAKSEQGE